MVNTRRPTVVASFAVAGLALAAYPAIRPYGPEVGLAGAANYASSAWMLSHVLGMLGFVALAFGLRAAAESAPWRWTGRLPRETETLAWSAVALLLPYYGAETYGLHHLGRHAVDEGDPSVLAVADAFRYSPFEVTTFSLGLLALALVGVGVVRGLWRSGVLGRSGAVLAGMGLATYLPQFFLAAGMRMAHGALLGTGLVLIAVAAARRTAPTEVRTPSEPVPTVA